MTEPIILVYDSAAKKDTSQSLRLSWDWYSSHSLRSVSLLQTDLYVWVLWVDVSVGQVWKVLEIQDEGFRLLLGLRLRKNTNRAVLRVRPPPLVAVGLGQETLDLVLLLQSLGGVLDPAAVTRVAVSLWAQVKDAGWRNSDPAKTVQKIKWLKGRKCLAACISADCGQTSLLITLRTKAGRDKWTV